LRTAKRGINKWDTTERFYEFLKLVADRHLEICTIYIQDEGRNKHKIQLAAGFVKTTIDPDVLVVV
jgi:pyruvate-formate lyase-activating enzyme